MSAPWKRPEVQERLAVCVSCEQYRNVRQCVRIEKTCNACHGGSIVGWILRGNDCPENKWRHQ